MACLIVLSALAACADDDTERRFANDPLPPNERSPDAAVVTAEATPLETVPLSSPVSPQALLMPAAAPDRIYFRSGRELWTIAADGTDPHAVLVPNGEIRAFATSPNGEQVAVLLVEDVQGTVRTTLLVLAADGTEQRRHESLETVFPATDGSVAPIPRAVSWSSVDDQLLVTFEQGGLLAVAVSGPPVLLVGAAQASHAGGASWSPAGDAIAYLQPVGTGEASGLYVARAGPAPLDPVAVISPAESGARTISGLAWLADGSGLLYSEAPANGASGGDLFAVSPAGDNRRLIASAGRAAPVAQVAEFAPSPDGQAVAFTVFTPTEDGPMFHSLWLQQLSGAVTIRLPVTIGETVTDLWWTSSGLVWQAEVNLARGVTDYQGGSFALYRASGEGDPVVLFEADLGVPATPGATPVSSPVASPVSD